MEIMMHPEQLAIAIILTAVSSFFLWNAFKERNVPNLLLGIGFSIPTVDIPNIWYWAAGAATCALGIWFKNAMDL